MSATPQVTHSHLAVEPFAPEAPPRNQPVIVDPLIALRPLLQDLKRLDDLSKAFYAKLKKAGPMYHINKMLQGPTGPASSCMATTGVISNIVAVVGAVSRSPALLLGGLVVSSTVLVINYEEEQQREILRNLVTKLQQTNTSLSISNESLRREIERLQQCIGDLRRENERLEENSRRLEESAADLQSKINTLNEHINHLERCNTLFEGNLSSLSSLLKGFSRDRAPLRAPAAMVEQMQNQLKKINEESLEFSNFFVTTRSIIDNKHEAIRGQVDILASTIEELLTKIDTLPAVKEVDNIKEHIIVSLRGLQQFQQSLQTTEQDLIHLKKQCFTQHKRLENSQKSCRALMTYLARNVVVTDPEE